MSNTVIRNGHCGQERVSFQEPKTKTLLSSVIVFGLIALVIQVGDNKTNENL